MQQRKAYYVDSNERKIYYADIGAKITREFPHLIGAYIFDQLEALWLLEGFDGGRTPYALPYSFTD